MAFATRIGLVVLGLLIEGMLAYTLLPAGRGSYAVCVLFGTLFGLLFTPGAEQGAQYLVTDVTQLSAVGVHRRHIEWP